MDPRLWEMLNLRPGVLYIVRAELRHGGSTLHLICRLVNERHPDGIVVDITFEHCREVRCQIIDPAHTDPVEALSVYLGEQSHRRPAVLYTGAAEMQVTYQSLVVAAQ